MFDPTFRNIKHFFILSFKNGKDDPAGVEEYYMLLLEIKDFNALIDNKHFLINP